MSPTHPNPFLFAAICGLLFSASCDDPPPENKCLEFLRCYAECRDEMEIGEDCDVSPLEQNAARMDAGRCFDICENGSFLDPSFFPFYPLENQDGRTWGVIAACLNGEQL